MKSWKDIYQLPLHKTAGSWIRDNKSQMLMQFIPRYDKGDYAKGWEDFEKNIIAVINGGSDYFDSHFMHKEGHIYMEEETEPILIIRGWGNLTGIGGHNLKPEEAANIQDTFAEYIVERLNFRG